ncbi:bis(5'-nucleosyl)-tetraphosphatase (symmetrical) YqeK [Candidatus Cyanaurora vandensis]|uniref:bis(5'-nucleosyl)-tetraphosphatase (symmetrical) YqeK n=1 Tax=Candidatus Cyanaurora vandensis TaxID=2714958 RepID=UPI00257C6348|nr:bis(5'-nucleosyl)-tetraphosphatase (symmetrical) YqeK [Candidatus Cyanaurora vandensis]
MREQVLTWLQAQVPRKRLQHILGVEKTAAQLAYHHGVDPQLAARAGLLHDLAKCFSPQQLLSEAERFRIPLDPVTTQNPHLLHAQVSAGLAGELFGEHDPQVLTAIANHTLGEPGMDDLSCIIYLADWIEPSRTGPELAPLRALAFEDLKGAVLLGCNLSLTELLAQDRPIHPRTVLTRNWLLSPVGVA